MKSFGVMLGTLACAAALSFAASGNPLTLWYNSDASQWQYWVEGLSSDYGDAGWMEYNDGQWYIETRPGSWVKYTDDNGTLWLAGTSLLTNYSDKSTMVPIFKSH